MIISGHIWGPRAVMGLLARVSPASPRDAEYLEVMPGRLDSSESLRFIDIKLSVSRSLRLYSRSLLVRRADQPHRLVRVAPDNPRPSPSRARRPITLALPSGHGE